MRIGIGLSGGVDSSVACALLQEEGHEVLGITLMLSDDPCIPDAASIDRARKLADDLGIRHVCHDVREAFCQQVTRWTAQSYASGNTPNPCAQCNMRIKFPLLLEAAGAYDCDLIATGHYARTVTFRHRLCVARAAREQRDQSYFLYGLDDDVLRRVRFPLGEYSKKEVRAYASKHHLPAYAAPDSQDVCFMDTGVQGFLERTRPDILRTGSFVLKDDTEVGQHGGAALYTIGQRKGLGVALGSAMYVTATDVEHNVVQLGSRDDLLVAEVLIASPYLKVELDRMSDIQVELQVRYRMNPVPAHMHWNASDASAPVLHVVPDQPLPGGAACGQVAVLYMGDVVVGGGEISAAVPACAR